MNSTKSYDYLFKNRESLQNEYIVVKTWFSQLLGIPSHKSTLPFITDDLGHRETEMTFSLFKILK